MAKRGRPRKQVEAVTKRKRGRPKKSEVVQTKRGRPKKSEKTKAIRYVVVGYRDYITIAKNLEEACRIASREMSDSVNGFTAEIYELGNNVPILIDMKVKVRVK